MDYKFNNLSLREQINYCKSHENYINWRFLTNKFKLSEDFIREFQDKVIWYNISRYQKLSEHFIKEFKDKVDWDYISEYQQLSEEFIEEFQDKVDWYSISIYQQLSEEFIEKFQNHVNWFFITIHQQLSEDFIRKFRRYIDWCNISKYQRLSKDFIEVVNLKIDDDNWLYKDEEYKKQQIINCGLYECYDEYFIAYKGIRSDRYSNFNFQYQYLKGKTYKAHADYTDGEYSFGLSVWTEKNAREYCNQLIVKVKVYYKDVARLVYNDSKIRCSKITILN